MQVLPRAGAHTGPPARTRTRAAGGERRKLRAAFSNAGLQSSWCALGKTTAELWGKLLDVDVEWFDGEFDSDFNALNSRNGWAFDSSDDLTPIPTLTAIPAPY